MCKRVWIRRHRPAFTRTEALAIFAFVILTIGLFLCGLQLVRAYQMKMNCDAHLKQMTLACHIYDDTNNSFPVGHRSFWKPAPRQHTGWTLDIIQFMEKDSIYRDSMNDFARQSDPFTHRHLSTYYRKYTCPSDPRVTRAQWCQKTGTFVAFTSYQGVSGIHLNDKKGMLIQDSGVSRHMISDGTSNTLLFGERPPSDDFVYGWWYAGVGQQFTGSLNLIMAVRETNVGDPQLTNQCGNGPFEFRPSRFDDPCGRFHYWSPHRGGANFSFADGSVRFIRYSLNPLLPILASRDDGDSIQID